MAKSAGREAVLKKNSTPIAGVQAKNITRDSAPINVSDDYSGGLQVVLGVAGESVIGLDIEGILDSDVLSDIAFSSTASQLLTDIKLEFVNGKTLSGDFFMSNFKLGMAYKEATTFSATLTSSEGWVYA